MISIDAHNHVTSKQLGWYYANKPNDFVNNNSWKWHAHCLIGIDLQHIEWNYANTSKAFERQKWHVHCVLISINSILAISKQLVWNYACKLHVCLNLFLIAPSPQSPFIHKWKGKWSRSKRKKPKVYNDKISYFCRMAYACSLEKSLDGVKDMEVTQSKKRTSSFASLTVVEKGKNKSNPQSKNFPL